MVNMSTNPNQNPHEVEDLKRRIAALEAELAAVKPQSSHARKEQLGQQRLTKIDGFVKPNPQELQFGPQ